MIKFIKNNIVVTLIILIATGLVYYFFTRETTLDIKDKANPRYVNNLYLSTDYVYNQLSKEEKKAFDFMFNSIKKGKHKRTVKYEDLDCSGYEDCYELLLTAHEAIAVEQPDLITYSSFMGSFDDDKVKIEFSNAMPFKFISEIGMLRIERIIDDIKKATKDMNDTQKVLYVYEWIGKHATYDRDYMFSSKNQSIYNVFMKHNAVCAGFGKTAAIIFQNIGIEAHAVTGHMNPGDAVGHMWNIVKVDGKYYFFDSTIAASIHNEKDENYYNGLIQLEMDSYQLAHPEWYPEKESNEIPNILSH